MSVLYSPLYLLRLYVLVRAASGIRNAEMKWTNHSKLDAYGVKLVGYPESIPLANPSSLSASQNRLLLDLFASGKTHFARIDGAPVAHTSVDEPSLQKDEDAIFEASIDYSWASTDHASGHTVPSVSKLRCRDRICALGTYGRSCHNR